MVKIVDSETGETQKIEMNADKVTITRTIQNSKVKIGYKEYEIVKEPEIINLPEELMGQINFQEEKIRISTKYSQNQQNQSFLHELVHGILEKLSLRELNDNETIVDQIATTLYEVILDNPHIFTMKDI